MSNKYVYPAVFRKKGSGYFVMFPDFQSCTTAGATLPKAVVMAKAVLEDRIRIMIAECSEAGEALELPEPSGIDTLKGDRVMLIVATLNSDYKDAETADDEASDVAGEGTQADLDAEKEKYLRLLAEYDNFRKRSFQDRENAAADAVVRTVTEMLNVTDNFERALAAECSDPNYKKGVEMIYSMFKDCLGRLGIAEIEALGKPFDPNFHEAVTQRADDNFGENTVCEVLQTGYSMNGKLVRPAMVAVANP